jgi:general secretion pathway protein L
MFIPTAVLAAVLLLTTVAALGYPKIRDRGYLAKLEAEIARIEPQARRAAGLDSEIEKTRARVRLLDSFRNRSKADLDALNALTQLLAPPIWANAVELSRESMQIGGEAEQAATLLQVIDGSPFFQNSQFTVPIARGQGAEIFRIRADREAGR